MEPGESEVGYFDVAIQSDQDVLGLHISVDDVVVVQKGDGFDDLAHHISDEILAKGFLLHVVVEISSLHVLHHYVDLPGVLEGLYYFHKEVILRGS